MRPAPVLVGCLLSLVAAVAAADMPQTVVRDGAHAVPAVAPPTPGADVVVNGSFEAPVVAGGFATRSAGTTFGNWTVQSGSVDHIHTYWLASEGVQSLDMAGTAPGTIYQDLPTVAGRQYTLSFRMAGNPTGSPTVKSMEVFWGVTSLGTFTFDITGKSVINMGWASHTVAALVATGATTRLTFKDLTTGGWGAALDDVKVIEGDPSGLVSLTLKKSTVAGCLKGTGKVTIAAPAPTGGTLVILSSSSPKARVAASVTVPAGKTTKTFPIATDPVAASETATISASTGGTPLSVVLTLRPIGPKSVALTPLSVVGGADVAGLVTLECVANPADITVTLWSTKPGAAVPDVTTMVVPQGTKTAPFGVTTLPVTVITKPTIKAKANDLVKAKRLVVNPAP